jgi:peptidylprolyl isomerase
VIPGFGAALVGQKVGTKLIVTIPPALGYGEEASDQNPLAGQTLVFVVEIQDTQAG